MYSAYFSTKMLLVKLAEMGNFCLNKSDAVWPMAQMATGSASLVWHTSIMVILFQVYLIVMVRCV